MNFYVLKIKPIAFPFDGDTKTGFIWYSFFYPGVISTVSEAKDMISLNGIGIGKY